MAGRVREAAARSWQIVVVSQHHDYDNACRQKKKEREH
jgi:hypothetical protein